MILVLAIFLLAGCRTVDVSESTFFRPRACAASDALDPAFEDLRLPVDEDVRLQVLAHVPRDASALLIYFGGNETRHCMDEPDRRTRLVSWSDDTKVAVALVNYRGYGQSQGRPGLESGRRDAMRVYDFLTIAPRFSERPVLVLGQSLGSSFAVALAESRPVDGLILESPPTTAREVLAGVTPFYVRPFVRYRITDPLRREDNSEEVENVTAPLLVLVGDKDEITPPQMAKKVVAGAGSAETSLVIVEGGHHGDLTRFDQFWSALEEFVGSVTSRE